MIRKINITLAILCTAGALFIGGMLLYEHFSDVSNGKIVQHMEEGL